MNYTDKIRDAKVIRRLGSGSRASVDLYENPDGSQFAVKLIHRDVISKEGLGPVLREINNLSKLRDQPHIIQIYGCSFYDNGVMIATEVCDGDLTSFLTDVNIVNIVTPESVNKLVTGISSAIKVLEKLNIQHNDIGYYNILYRKTPLGDEFKLADFGSSTPLTIFNRDLHHLKVNVEQIVSSIKNLDSTAEWASIYRWLDEAAVETDSTNTAVLNQDQDRVEFILQRLPWLEAEIKEINLWRDVVTEMVKALDNQKDRLVSSTDDIARVFYSLEGRLL